MLGRKWIVLHRKNDGKYWNNDDDNRCDTRLFFFWNVLKWLPNPIVCPIADDYSNDMSKSTNSTQNYVNVWRCVLISIFAHGNIKSTYLKLRSGEAQRTAILGIGGTKRIAIITWFFQRRDSESRWLSDGVFFGGAELRNNDARLSFTGLRTSKWSKKMEHFQLPCKAIIHIAINLYPKWMELIEKLTSGRLRWIEWSFVDRILAMLAQQQLDIVVWFVRVP